MFIYRVIWKEFNTIEQIENYNLHKETAVVEKLQNYIKNEILQEKLIELFHIESTIYPQEHVYSVDKIVKMQI